MKKPHFLTHPNQPALPGIGALQRRRFDKAFEQGEYAGMCRGIYANYDAAAAAAPKSLPLGYDHEGPAAMYRERLKTVYPSDYPMMHWLARAFADQATSVFDLGGHVGISYYAYQRYLDFPDGLSWQVNDVPAVNALGRELAEMLDERRAISFTDQFAGAQEAQVLFTAGCLQYLQESLAEKLAGLAAKPRWVLVNLLPLHEREAYWTVQNIKTAFCPYRIQRRDQFFAEMKAQGYRLLDQWDNPEKHCEIAFDPEHSLDQYVGAAFRLAK